MVVQKRFLQGDRQGQADNFLPISVPAQGRAATSPPRALHRRMTRALDDNLMERNTPDAAAQTGDDGDDGVDDGGDEAATLSNVNVARVLQAIEHRHFVSYAP